MNALRALVLAAAALPAIAGAAGGGYPLQAANADVSNLASLQRGARNFVNYCLGCHSARYMRYSQVAADLALTEDELRSNLMFTGSRVYDTMDTAMPADKAREWFGNAPPDLSLIVRSRGADYVYTFLRSFYADPTRPTGVDNAVLPGTAMPHVLAGLQGLQRPRYEKVTGKDGQAVDHLAGLEPGVPASRPPPPTTASCATPSPSSSTSPSPTRRSARRSASGSSCSCSCSPLSRGSSTRNTGRT